LLVLAAPAAAEVWSGWVGIAQKTGFGLVSPLPGIWPSLHLDTAVTLPVGVEAYAAYALRAWLAGDQVISDRSRRFAKWSAICSFALGMAGQVAYHLMAQAGMARAPWAVTTIVSCLPVLVLAMGTALAHMLRADAGTADNGTGPPAALRSLAWSSGHRARPDRRPPEADRDRPGRPDQHVPAPGSQPSRPVAGPVPRPVQPQLEEARIVARGLLGAGKPVSRRALRSGGVKGSNEALNALASAINAELASVLAARETGSSKPGWWSRAAELHGSGLSHARDVDHADSGISQASGVYVIMKACRGGRPAR
jgi:hypothetical protein